jgi:hypothetical protein
MSRVDLSGTGIEQIVGNKERVPGVDEINRGIVSDLKVAVQSKEPLEGMKDGVMESDRVQAVVTGGPKEKLILARGDVDHLLKAWLLFWRSTTSAEAASLSTFPISRT